MTHEMNNDDDRKHLAAITLNIPLRQDHYSDHAECAITKWWTAIGLGSVGCDEHALASQRLKTCHKLFMGCCKTICRTRISKTQLRKINLFRNDETVFFSFDKRNPVNQSRKLPSCSSSSHNFKELGLFIQFRVPFRESNNQITKKTLMFNYLCASRIQGKFSRGIHPSATAVRPSVARRTLQNQKKWIKSSSSSSTMTSSVVLQDTNRKVNQPFFAYEELSFFKQK